MNNRETFEFGEEVLVGIGTHKNKVAIYECQMTYSTDPMQDRFRVRLDDRDVYISRREISKK